MATVSIDTISSSLSVRDYTVSIKKSAIPIVSNINNIDYTISIRKNITSVMLTHNINNTIQIIKKLLDSALLVISPPNNLYFEEDYGDKNYSDGLHQSLKVKKQLLNAKLNTNINWFIYKNHDKEVKVVKIDNIVLTYPLIYSKNFNEERYISNSLLAVDGSSIVNVMKKAKFSSKYTLKGDYIHKDIINQLFSSISKNIITLEFNNGFWIEAKYNLLENTIAIKDVFEGAEYFNITIKVLV